MAVSAEDDSWAEDRYNPIYYLVRVEKVALPLYPQFGTEPNGYYIPPRWVPRPYLQQMFGPGVDQAIERYAAPSRELATLAELAGFYRAFGVQLSNDARERPDHISVELEFLAFLLAKEARALDQSLDEQAELCREAERRFLRDQAAWLPTFAEAARAAAGSDLERAAATLAAALYRTECERLGVAAASLRGPVPSPAWRGDGADDACDGCPVADGAWPCGA